MIEISSNVICWPTNTDYVIAGLYDHDGHLLKVFKAWYPWAWFLSGLIVGILCMWLWNQRSGARG